MHIQINDTFCLSNYYGRIIFIIMRGGSIYGVPPLNRAINKPSLMQIIFKLCVDSCQVMCLFTIFVVPKADSK